MKINFVGDIGSYNDITSVIFKNIIDNSNSDDIIILLGDNFYPNGIKSINDINWEKFNNLNIPIATYSVLGNHDYLGNINAQIEYKLNNWNMDSNYYKKSTDKYDLFFIDTNVITPEYSNLNYNIVKSKLKEEPLEYSKKMLEWLDDELSKSTKVKIVMGHYPIISHGIYGINHILFKKLFPIFKKHNVSYYFSGHDHNLQIIDVTSENYILKQVISGSSSCIYPLFNNISKKIFSKNGHVTIDTSDESVNIIDNKNKIIYSEKN
jgi:predicted MPP superfamily phosphohydrolase